MLVRAKLTAVGIVTLMSCRPKRETSVAWQPDFVPNCADKVCKITTAIDILVAQSQQSLLCCLLSWSSSVTACPQHVEAFSTMPQAAVMLQRALSDKVWSASAYITPGLSLDDVALAFIWTSIRVPTDVSPTHFGLFDDNSWDVRPVSAKRLMIKKFFGEMSCRWNFRILPLNAINDYRGTARFSALRITICPFPSDNVLNANRVLWTYFPTFVDLFSYTL